MPDGLYERDILAWSEAQADPLRRLARGERVKVYLEPLAYADKHWRQEINIFQSYANDRFSPSMRQRIEVDRLYHEVTKGFLAEDKTAPLPDDNPFTLDQLLTGSANDLLARIPPQA